MPDYGVTDVISGYASPLIQYSTFRYHSGLGSPSFRLLDWWHNNGVPDRWFRVGLRDTNGNQPHASLQWDPGQGYTWKTFAWHTAGSYALNVRSADYGGGLITWSGTLRLS